MRNRKDFNPSTSVSEIREARLVRKWATARMIRAEFLVMSSSYSIFLNFVTKTLDFDLKFSL